MDFEDFELEDSLSTLLILLLEEAAGLIGIISSIASEEKEPSMGRVTGVLAVSPIMEPNES